jgi:hypothetical protein
VFDEGYDVIAIDSIAEVIEMVKDNYRTTEGAAESWFLGLQDKNKKGQNKKKYYTTFLNIQQVTKAGEFAGSNTQGERGIAIGDSALKETGSILSLFKGTITNATQTSLTVQWVGNQTATGYRLKVLSGGSPAFEQDYSSATSAAIATGLAASTDYEVVVGTLCDSSPVTTCNSVTILVTTPGLL